MNTILRANLDRKIDFICKFSRFLYVAVLFGLATHSFAQQQKETLGRGVVAVSLSETSTFISWRLLVDDPEEVAFNVYRNDVKLNDEPIVSSTNFMDSEASSGATYHVVAVLEGVEQDTSATIEPWDQNYLDIPLDRPAGGTTPDDVAYTYTPNDASVGDLDGDNEYEIVLKWDPTNSKDNAQSGHTGNAYLDAYELDGTQLWRVDLGVNIRAGAHYTQFMVYDLDGDGKAEIACKTAPGTKDATGAYLSEGPAASADHSQDYRNSDGYILDGPEYFTIFSGETGEELATVDYVPQRGNINDWGDNYGNRGDRFLACVAYLDGTRPSVVMCRGYYTRTVLAAWDWRDGSLTQRWVFDSNNGYPTYAGQGNHNLSVADVDDDGKDEIIYGACAIDDDGTGLWTTGLGHGDAMHVTDIDPERPGLERWGITENPSTSGSQLLDAQTGEIIWETPPGDIPRGTAADLVADHIGLESWGGTPNLRSAKNASVGPTPSSTNHVVWWDGDLLRELLNGTSIRKYNRDGEDEVLLTAEGCESNNYSKSNPALQADLFGDWREEVIWRTADNNALRIFTTTNVTDYRIVSLMQDHVYRLGIAWQNVAYNQPPHTGFYLGSHMFVADTLWPPAPPSNVTGQSLNDTVKLQWDANVEADIAGYLVARSKSQEGSFDTLTVDLIAETNFTDTTVINDTTYYYALIAVDTAGNRSGYSPLVEVTPTARPDAPTGFYARPDLEVVGLFWGQMGEGIAGFNIYRSVSGAAFELVNTENLAVDTFFVDDQIADGTDVTRSYKITSVSTAGLESFQTDEITVTPGKSYTLQAEEGGVTGTVFFESEHVGYNGSGYVNFDSNNSMITFDNLGGLGGGLATFEMRYALGSGARTGELMVNGETQPLTMEGTEGWTTYMTSNVTIELKEGFDNSLSISSTGSDFGNLDEITLIQQEQPVVTEIEDDGLGSFSKIYPNPFDQSTTIEYSVKASVNVSVQIFNMLGQRVKTLTENLHKPGNYKVVWDSRDDSGVLLSNGIYLCRISIGEGEGDLKRLLFIGEK